jgi:deoxyhypusine synthase
MTQQQDNAAPAGAQAAVLVKSEQMPEGSQQVEELDFNKIKGPVTAEDLLKGMKNMGFQASAMSEAVRIINNMVSPIRLLQLAETYKSLTSVSASLERP